MYNYLNSQNNIRDTLVVEFLCNKPVGFNTEGEEKICRYMYGLANILKLSPMRKVVTHLSEKYGLSAWLPLTSGSIIHAYVWDNRYPSFVSVDISTSNSWNLSAILNYTKAYFHVLDNDLVNKTMRKPQNATWTELADDVWRQRLHISSEYYELRIKEEIIDFLLLLCDVLKMKQLTAPLIHKTTAWMHWETSGCIVDWSRNRLNIDIYTCKEFIPKHAIDFTKQFFNLNQVFAQEY